MRSEDNRENELLMIHIYIYILHFLNINFNILLEKKYSPVMT